SIWKLESGQTNLKKINEGLPFAGNVLGVLRVGPDDTLYIAYNDFNPGSSTYNYGVYSSNNAGETWTPILKGLPQHDAGMISYTDLKISERDNSLYLSVAGVRDTGQEGVYKFASGNTSWKKITMEGLPANNDVFVGLAVDPLLGLHVSVGLDGVYAQVPTEN
ncbi:MAG: hypothetical protein ACHP9Y_05415, partial [Gammaproteobacteria bacterium]